MTVSTRKSRLSIRLFACAIALAAAGFFSASAGAGDDNWIYRRSYFSHVLPPEIQARYPIPVSRSAYRLPIVDMSPSFGAQGVERYNTIYLDHGNDVMIYHSFWVQGRP
jgi:hypothetical protein